MTTPTLPADLKARLTDIISEGLRGTYHCTRVWEAWNVGTMSEEDFGPVEESDTPAELADAVIAALAATPPAPGPQAVAEPSLSFAHFRHANVTRCLKWHPQGLSSWSPSDWLTAALGELGELASEVKTFNRERDGLVGNKQAYTPEERKTRMAKEAADVVTYIDLFCAERGIDLGTAIVDKFNEVSERVGFPDRIVLATQPPTQQASEVTCRHCNGSGEAPYLSGGGPDAYDMTGPCATCKGTGAVAAPQQASAQAQQASAQPTQAAKDVLDERQRQISVEGWTAEHDDKYKGDELALAAASYAISDKAHMSPPGFWPWDRKWWKPSDDGRRNLVKAGALILAEIERLDRAASRIRPDGFPTWICKTCDNPAYCVKIQGCDREEMNK